METQSMLPAACTSCDCTLSGPDDYTRTRFGANRGPLAPLPTGQSRVLEDRHLAPSVNRVDERHARHPKRAQGIKPAVALR
jgi:hypothetical protein